MYRARSLLLCLAAMLAVQLKQAIACSARRSNAPATATVERLGANRWRLCFPGYRTSKLGSGISFCASGISLPANAPITSVDRLRLHDERTGATLLRYSFAQDTAIAREFARLSPGAWTGFFGRASGPLPGGVDHMLCFEVTARTGTTLAQMTSVVGQCVIGTDESNAVRGLTRSLLFLLQPRSVVGDTLQRHLKMLHNTRHADLATRIGFDNTINEIFYAEPLSFRLGHGAGTGFEVRLQDEEASTVEEVDLGFVGVSLSGKPDVTPPGRITNARFELFGAGSGRVAMTWRLTLPVAVPLPARTGLRIALPPPRSWPSDGVTIHGQSGATTKTRPALREQWTHKRVSTTAQPWLVLGSTLHFGGLYDAGVTQMFAFSSAYGPVERLFGPEALYPDVGRRDTVGIRVEHAGFANQFAAIMAAPNYRSSAVVTPFGPILIENLVSVGAFQLDANGVGVTPTVPVPAGLTIAMQTALLDLPNGRIRFTDAARLQSL